MTEDQIKAIAEEYAMQNPPSTTDEIFKHQVARLNAEQVFEPFLRFLNERYCMVEREKVMDEYKETCDEIAFEAGNKSVLHQNVALGRKSLLESLFGTSMFNQDEE